MIILIRRLRPLGRGYVRIRLLGGSYERFFNLCANHRILLWDIRPAEKGYEANLFQKDFFRLRPLASKCRTRVRICEKCGLPFFLNRHRKRKAFALGLCLCGFLIFFLSCFVWNISIEGNLSISRRTMLEYLAEKDVDYGALKSRIDCKALAADLRAHFPDLIWVAVKLQGTCLFVQVKENHNIPEELPEYEDSDLVADADGVIVRMVTREGAPAVSEGDFVRKGDILIRGEMAITDDSGNIVSYRYCAADADVYIQTELPYDDAFSLVYDTVSYTGKKRYGLYCSLWGKHFGVDFGTHDFEMADLTGEEHQLCLLEDFYLPVSFGIVTSREYRNAVQMYTPMEARRLAAERLKKFLSEIEEKGVQIFENNVTINISATSCHARGTVTAIARTGRRVRTQKSDLPQEGTDE